MRAQPIVFLPLIQKHLQSSNSKRQHGNSHVVHADPSAFYATEERWIFNQCIGQIESQENRRQGNEKDPAPRIVVGNPAAQHRPDCGCENRGDAVKSKCDAAFFWRKGIVENSLGHRLQAASPIPCRARKNSNTGRLGASPQSKELNVKIDRESMKYRLRPIISASQPLMGRTMAFAAR